MPQITQKMADYAAQGWQMAPTITAKATTAAAVDKKIDFTNPFTGYPEPEARKSFLSVNNPWLTPLMLLAAAVLFVYFLNRK